MSVESSHPYAGGSRSDRRVLVFVWFVVFAAAMTLYAVTAGRTIQWQDSGLTTLRIVKGEVGNDLGLALVHPLYHWLGRGATAILPIEPAWAVALVSALGAAIGVANVFGCVRAITDRSGGALLAAGSLMVAHTYWQLSGTAETYTVTVALLTAELWCLVLFWKRGDGWWWVGACLFNGIGLSNHNLALLTIPVLMVCWFGNYRRLNRPWRRAMHGLVVWVAGASLYLVMVLWAMIDSGDVMGTVRSALFGHGYADAVLGVAPGLKPLMISGAFTLLSFPNLTLIALLAGLLVMRDAWLSRGTVWTLIAACVIHLLFVVRYNVVDQHTFLLPTFSIVAIIAGLGYDRMVRGRGVTWLALSWLMLLGTPVLYYYAPQLARDAGVLGSLERHKPYRDDYQYLFNPWTVQELSAERMSDEAVALAGLDGVIVVEDRMASFAVRYKLVLAGLDDEKMVVSSVGDTLVSEAIESGRWVVLVPASVETEPKPIGGAGQWEAAGELYRWNPYGVGL